MATPDKNTCGKHACCDIRQVNETFAPTHLSVLVKGMAVLLIHPLTIGAIIFATSQPN
ncbi:MAG TPA: hypothetical protein PK299_11595 [Anaerolineales bacterium]|nr:hypothetical protein [Anaerolineales bacterium]